jgi:anti-sigma28 factor (negative regulator of flagellin synthesis)
MKITGSAIAQTNHLSQAIPSGAQAGQLPEALAGTEDGIRFSSVIAALDRTPQIARVTAAVEDGSYQIDSAATSSALVEDALSGQVSRAAPLQSRFNNG